MTSAHPTRHERLVAAPTSTPITIGELSARTGVPVKRLRRYDDLGFLYTLGRSAGNFRLYDESALWCVSNRAALAGEWDFHQTDPRCHRHA